MMQRLSDRLSNDFIPHDGGKCPCVGEWVTVMYSDGMVEHGPAYDHAYWRYVTHYRLIADPASVV